MSEPKLNVKLFKKVIKRVKAIFKARGKEIKL
jgi:hypothetical protein